MLYILDRYLLPENRLSLTTKSLLFTIVTTSSLSGFTFLGLFVLRHFMQFVALAFFAKSATLFRYVNLLINLRLWINIVKNTWVDKHNLKTFKHNISIKNDFKWIYFNMFSKYTKHLYLVYLISWWGWSNMDLNAFLSSTYHFQCSTLWQQQSKENVQCCTHWSCNSARKLLLESVQYQCSSDAISIYVQFTSTNI